MTSIESQLRLIGSVVEYPNTPDIAGEIAELLADRAPTRRLRRYAVAVAAAAVLIAVVVGLVPATREAVMSWLGIQGIRIERADVVAAAEPLDIGEPVTVEEAETAVGFELSYPTTLDEPQLAFVSGRRASLVYPAPQGGAELVLTQFRGDIELVIAKQVPFETAMSLAPVGDTTGVWIEGPHAVIILAAGRDFEDEPRLAGNTLLWERGDVTFRLEGAASLAEATRLAESVG